MASLAAARHDFAGALEWGRRGEAVNPANADIHAITGDAFVELGRYPEAFGEFQHARTWTHLVDGVELLNEYGVVTVTVFPPALYT